MILTYIVIQQKPHKLIDKLADYQKDFDNKNQAERLNLFLTVRKELNETEIKINYKKLTDLLIKRAAQFIFLNKTCFNGLFRLNSKGKFNVPYGKYKTASICDAENISAASQSLNKAEIYQASYGECYQRINDAAFVYFDPPYKPISKTASFTTYTGFEFADKQQQELSLFFKKIDKELGAKLMLSNSNPNDGFFQKIYKGYNISKVYANRYVNCNGDKRGKISELVITNYLKSTIK